VKFFEFESPSGVVKSKQEDVFGAMPGYKQFLLELQTRDTNVDIGHQSHILNGLYCLTTVRSPFRNNLNIEEFWTFLVMKMIAIAT
jgi:hypothetical protein